MDFFHQPGPGVLAFSFGSGIFGTLELNLKKVHVQLWVQTLWLLTNGWWFHHFLFEQLNKNDGFNKPVFGNEHLVGGWTNPFEKYDRQIGSFPQIGMNMKQYLKPPPSSSMVVFHHFLFDKKIAVLKSKWIVFYKDLGIKITPKMLSPQKSLKPTT